ncbi:LysR family transcriptional regulator [Sphingomonas oleivorans]|uniref:LysR family transcriptional regulator n=1 Tax=Sphingomonas oleivorans TaxID=1735121 RepID=A0A2T5G1V9_9SPHN|nr:LysR substrate-binding domain-containing protein [Sphingomonas oleivorans]PTQ13122.1 LysR family transcriptional regulator [Sphingomonas oleivorans]
MELRHLRYFLCVAEELHFGRAALRLGISQPPLSQQIRALEDDLGVRLFRRTSRRVELTDVGQLFVEEARRTIHQAEQAVAVARRAQGGEIGRLAIGFSTSAPLTPLVTKALFAFRRSHPNVHLDLAEMSRDAQIAAVADRRLDIGFVRSIDSPPTPKGLVATMLLEEDMLVAMRGDHPLAGIGRAIRIGDLEGEPFVLYERDLGAGFNEQVMLLCRRAGFEPKVVQTVQGLASLLGLVAAGFGLTILTRSLMALHPENVVYRPLDDPAAVSRLWFIHRNQPCPPCTRFIDIVSAGPGHDAAHDQDRTVGADV